MPQQCPSSAHTRNWTAAAMSYEYSLNLAIHVFGLAGITQITKRQWQLYHSCWLQKHPEGQRWVFRRLFVLCIACTYIYLPP